MRILLSYRSGATTEIAARLEKRLAERFGRRGVMRSPSFGAAKATASSRMVHGHRHLWAAHTEKAQVLLVVLGRDGLRSLETEADPGRLAVEEALGQGLIVVPVMVDGAVMPDADALPQGLRPMLAFPAVSVDSGEGFDHDVQRLIGAITDEAERRMRWSAKERAVQAALKERAEQVPEAMSGRVRGLPTRSFAQKGWFWAPALAIALIPVLLASDSDHRTEEGPAGVSRAAAAPRLAPVTERAASGGLPRPAKASPQLFTGSREARDGLPIPVHAATRPLSPLIAPLSSTSRAVRSSPGSSPDRVALSGGRFRMGSSLSGHHDADEAPAHWVRLAAFEIDRTEVTVSQYRRCVAVGRCAERTTMHWGGNSEAARALYGGAACNLSRPDRDDHPVNCVSWNDARDYCEFAGGRLPTEAEWEYAAQGPKEDAIYPWGDEPPSESRLNACGEECRDLGRRYERLMVAMYAGRDGWDTTAPVGSFPAGASRFGVLDMAGNVWEWVADRHGPYPAGSQQDPGGPSQGSVRVLRGGGYYSGDAGSVRSANRFRARPQSRTATVGFRCVHAAR